MTVRRNARLAALAALTEREQRTERERKAKRCIPLRNCKRIITGILI